MSDIAKDCAAFASLVMFVASVSVFMMAL